MSVLPLLANRFNPVIDRIWEQSGCPEKMAVAVSGGADSMALLCLLHEWGKADICALNVNHGYRKEAVAEGEMVADFAEKIGVEYHILEAERKDSGVDSVTQEDARDLRYGLLREFCFQNGYSYICLGHHAKDQAETVLMRLLKSNSLASLSGILPIQKYGDLALLRPMLAISKEEILDFCEERNIIFCDDVSNKNLKWLRPRLRYLWGELEDEGVTIDRLCRISVAAQKLSLACEEEFAEMADRYLEIMPEGYGLLDDEFFEDSDSKPGLMMQFLGRVAAIFGGSRYLPKAKSMEHLAKRLCGGKETATLANAAFYYKEMQKKWLIVREARNFETEIIIQNKAFLWDGRYWVEVNNGDNFEENWVITNWGQVDEGKLTSSSISYAKKHDYRTRQGFPVLISPKGKALLAFSGVSEYDKIGYKIKFMPEKCFLPIVK